MKSISGAWRPALMAVLAVVALCYLHGFYEEYVFDDAGLIGRNESIKSIEYLPSLIGWGKATVPGHRVIRNLSYVLDYVVWGDNVRGYHYSSLFIHLLNTVLVLGLARRLLGEGPWPYLAALLWGVHPVLTDAVTYLSGRRDVLSALFYLWALDRYLAWRMREAGRGALAASYVLYLVGCFTKEVAVTLPAVIVLYEVVNARRAEPDPKHPLATLARQAFAQFMTAPVYYTLLAAFPGAFTWYILHYHPFNVVTGYVTERLKTDLLSVATYGLHYLVLMVFPRDLSVDYFPQSLPGSPGIADPTTLVAIAVLSGLAVLTLIAIARGSPAGFGAGFFVIAFLPMSNLFIRFNEPVAEHYLYLPAVGMALAVTSGLRVLARRWPDARDGLVTAAVVAALALALRTDARNREWGDPEQLFTSSLAIFPRSSRMWNNLGCIYIHRGDLAGAKGAVERAIELSPREPLYHYNRAFIMRKEGRWADALVEYDRSLAVAPDYVDAQIGRAFDLIQLKRYDEALSEYRVILEERADDPHAWYYHHWSGVAQREKGDFARARAEFDVALELGHRHPETLWQKALGVIAEARASRASGALHAEAETLLKEAIEKAPESAVLQGVLGDLYREIGRSEDALAAYRAMAAADDAYVADAALRRARLLVTLKRLDEARETYAVARSYDFKDPELDAQLAGSSPRSR